MEKSKAEKGNRDAMAGGGGEVTVLNKMSERALLRR